jgi:1-acyl-sn-glycerol-3-phosphate acyltransferase
LAVPFLFVTSREVFKYPPNVISGGLRLIAWGISKVLWRLRYRGIENIPRDPEKPFIIASNHQTYFDPAWITFPIRNKIRFMAFAPAFSWKLVGRFIRYLGAFPVGSKRGEMQYAVREALNALRDGACLVIFPEGGREFADGRVLPLRSGVAAIALHAAAIALHARVPILPVTIEGGNRVWPRGERYPRPFSGVTVTYHPLIEITDKEQSGEEELINELGRVLTRTPMAEADSVGSRA